MEVPDSTVKLIDFSHSNLDIAQILGELSYQIYKELPTAELLNKLDTSIKESYIVDSPLGFKSKWASEYFYSVFYLEEHLKKSENLETILKSFNFKHLGQKIQLSYTIVSALLINAEKLFKIDVSELVSQKSLGMLVESAFYENISYFNPDSIYFLKAIEVSTNGLRAEGNHLTLNKAFTALGMKSPNAAFRVIGHFEDDDIRAMLFIPHIIYGIATTNGFSNVLDIIIKYLETESSVRQILGARTLVLFHGDNDDLTKYLPKIEPLFEIIINSGKIEVIQMVVNFWGVQIGKIEGSFKRITDILDKYHDDSLLNTLAFILWIKSDKYCEDDWFKESLKRLSSFNDSHSGIFNNLHMAFFGLRKVNEELVYNYFEWYIESPNNNPTSIEGFKSVFQELATDNLQNLQKRITIWLNNDNPRYHIAVYTITRILDLSNIRLLELDKSVLDSFSLFDIQFVLYKIAGYVHSKELLESLIFSSLKRAPIEKWHLQEVANIFYHYIYYNYPDSINFLEQKRAGATDAELAVINGVTEAINANDNVKLNKPNELKPSGKRLQKLFSKWSEQISDSMEDNGKFREPSFLDFAKKITLKNGNGYFTRMPKEFGKRQYSEISYMQSITSEFLPPIGEFVDPVGQAFQRYKWRTFKRQIK